VSDARFTGTVLSVDRRGGVTVRVGDKLIVIPEHEAQRAEVHLQPGDLVTLRLDTKAVLPLGCEPALATEAAE
jgi:hypothetical protein